ncbi:MAG: hypothetical protein OEY19_08615 [Gammaproteobacteria bacterium]|nr:hypothetical protein [Gammaproteobacteria bacterium]MDH5630582.1 hypothetical protein [Gammaproteobacteria bacterium]
MLPTCREVAEQLSENIDKPISGFRWFKLKLHLLMCVYCRRYDKQLNITSKAIKLSELTKAPNKELGKLLTSFFIQNHAECKHHMDNESQNKK